jgi:hypothetical protein
LTNADEVLGPEVKSVSFFMNGSTSEKRKKHVHQQKNKTNKIAEYLRNDRKKATYRNQ